MKFSFWQRINVLNFLGSDISVFDICQSGERGLFGLVLYYFSRRIFS